MKLKLYPFVPPADEEPLYSLVVDEKTRDVLAIIWWDQGVASIVDGINAKQLTAVKSLLCEQDNQVSEVKNSSAEIGVTSCCHTPL